MKLLLCIALLMTAGCFTPRYEVTDWQARPGLEAAFDECLQRAEEQTFHMYLSTSGLIPRQRAEYLLGQCMQRHGYVLKGVPQ